MQWFCGPLLIWFLPLTVRGVRQVGNEGDLVDTREKPKPHIDWNQTGPTAVEIPQTWTVGEVSQWMRDKATGAVVKDTMLIPALAIPTGSYFQMKVKEKAEAFNTDSYAWYLDKVNEDALKLPIANLSGSWTSSRFGHMSVHVKNGDFVEVFKIRSTWSRMFKLFNMHWSFRILPAHSKDNKAAWFTINRDVFGLGMLGKKKEWRVYKGHAKEGNMVYYAVGDYHGWDFWIYTSKEAYDDGAMPVAQISQEWNAGAVIDYIPLLRRMINFAPDKFGIRIKSGEDPGLLMALCTVINMVYGKEKR